MSLLDRGPDTIVVYPAGPVNPDGTRGPAGSPVTVKNVRVQPTSSSTDGEAGYATLTSYRIIGRRLPAGPWDRVRWDDYDWTVAAQPEKWRGSTRLSHDTAIIRRR